jgi:hypothetical protein
MGRGFPRVALFYCSVPRSDNRASQLILLVLTPQMCGAIFIRDVDILNAVASGRALPQ